MISALVDRHVKQGSTMKESVEAGLADTKSYTTQKETTAYKSDERVNDCLVVTGDWDRSVQTQL